LYVSSFDCLCKLYALTRVTIVSLRRHKPLNADLPEYNIDSDLEMIGYTLARWADGGWDAVDKADADGKLFGIMIVQDRWQRPVLLFRNDWKAEGVATEEKYLELKPWSKPPMFE